MAAHSTKNYNPQGGIMMRRFFLCFFAVMFSATAQVSTFGLLSSKDETRSINSMANLYTAVQVKDISTYGAIITVTTTWPKYLLIGFYNPRTDSTGRIMAITQAGDTVPWTIATSSYSGKVPPLSKIITASSTDRITFYFQRIQP